MTNQMNNLLIVKSLQSRFVNGGLLLFNVKVNLFLELFPHTSVSIQEVLFCM